MFSDNYKKTSIQENIPREILNYIIQYCTQESLLSIRRTCFIFKQCVEESGLIKFVLKSKNFDDPNFEYYLGKNKQQKNHNNSITINDLENGSNSLNFIISNIHEISFIAFPSNDPENELRYFNEKLHSILTTLENNSNNNSSLKKISINCLVVHWPGFVRFLDRINTSSLQFLVNVKIHLSLDYQPYDSTNPILLPDKLHAITFYFSNFIDYPATNSTDVQQQYDMGKSFFTYFKFSPNSKLNRLVLININQPSTPIFNPSELSKFLTPCHQLKCLELDSVHLLGLIGSNKQQEACLWLPENINEVSFIYSKLYLTKRVIGEDIDFAVDELSPFIICNAKKIEMEGLDKSIGLDQYLGLFERINFPHLEELNLDMSLKINSVSFLTNILRTLKKLNLYITDWEVLNDQQIVQEFKTSPLAQLFIESDSGLISYRALQYLYNLKHLEILTLIFNIDSSTINPDEADTNQIFITFLNEIFEYCRHLKTIKVGEDILPLIDIPINNLDEFSIAELDFPRDNE